MDLSLVVLLLMCWSGVYKYTLLTQEIKNSNIFYFITKQLLNKILIYLTTLPTAIFTTYILIIYVT